MNWDLLTTSGQHGPSVGVDPEFYPGGIPRKSYDNIPALSCTVIKQWMRMQRTPSKFKWWLEHRWLEDKTPALILGGFLDAILLDPKEASKYAVLPEDAPRRPTQLQIHAKKPSEATLASIAFWRKWEEENNGKHLVTHEQCLAANAMAVSLKTAKTNAGVFENCHKAVAVANLFNEPWKCEFDLWSRRSFHIGDVKTCAEIQPEEFGRAAFRFDYQIQATLYLLLARAAGFNKEVFSFLCVESAEPWTPITINFRPFANEDHRQVFEATSEKLARAVVSLREAVNAGFVDPVNWDDLIVPRWELSRSKQEYLTY